MRAVHNETKFNLLLWIRPRYAPQGFPPQLTIIIENEFLRVNS